MQFHSSKIVQHNSDERYNLVPASDIECNDIFFNEIVQICNEPIIYKQLFEKLCNKKAYPITKAQEFITWAKDGFENTSHFVFIITTPKNTPVGAIDIKSNNLNSAEIGYWLSHHYSGLMTNGVYEIAKQAQANDFCQLYAMCEITNQRSKAVLERASFTNNGKCVRNSKEYFKYSKTLQS